MVSTPAKPAEETAALAVAWSPIPVQGSTSVLRALPPSVLSMLTILKHGETNTMAQGHGSEVTLVSASVPSWGSSKGRVRFFFSVLVVTN